MKNNQNGNGNTEMITNKMTKFIKATPWGLLALLCLANSLSLLQGCGGSPGTQVPTAEERRAQMRALQEARCEEMYVDADIHRLWAWCLGESVLIRQSARQAACQTVEEYERTCSNIQQDE